MEVKRYIYQSPYNAPVQFGRPDPSSKESESANYELNKNSNETLKKAEIVKTKLQNEAAGKEQESRSNSIKPRVLDVYA